MGGGPGLTGGGPGGGGLALGCGDGDRESAGEKASLALLCFLSPRAGDTDREGDREDRESTDRDLELRLRRRF